MKDYDVSKPLYEEVKAGGILYRIENGDVYICLVHRPKINDWSMPKGHVSERESLQDAAIREVAEETEMDGEVETYLGLQTWEWSDDEGGLHLCRNHVFLMKYTGKSDTPLFEEEVDEVVWLPLEESEKRATYQDTKEILKQVKKHLGKG